MYSMMYCVFIIHYGDQLSVIVQYLINVGACSHLPQSLHWQYYGTCVSLDLIHGD